MNDNPAGEVRPMIHRKPPNDTATWSASLRSGLWAASRAGPGRQTLASCGRPMHDLRSGAGKRGIPAECISARGLRPARARRPPAGGVGRHHKLTPWRHEELTPSKRGEGDEPTRQRGKAADGGPAEEEDADAGRGRGDAAAARAGLGHEADRGRVRLQPEHGEALPRAAAAGRRYRRPERAKALDGLEDWLAERFRRHRGNADVVRQELLAEHGIRRQPAHGRAGGGASAARAGGRGAGDGALRDAAGPADADRLRRDARGDRRRDGPGLPVRRDARLLAPALRPGVPARAAGGWFDGIEGAFRALRRGAGRGPARQRPGAGRAPRRGRPARWRSTTGCTPSPRYWGVPAAGLRALPGADQGQGRARRRLRQAQRHRRPRVSRAGRRWRRTSPGGCARSPTCASTARRASRRSSASSATRRRRCGRSTAGRRSGRCASSSAGCRRTAASRSTPTPTACPGG